MVPKILILRLSSLGDIVHASAALPLLRKVSADIAWVVKPPFAPLLEATASDVRVYRFDKSGGEAEAKQKLFTWIREQKFTAILDLHDSLRTRRWRAELRALAPVFVAKKTRWRDWRVLLLRQKEAGLGPGGRARHMQAAARELLTKIGLPAELGSSDPALTYLKAPSLDANWKERLPQRYAVLVPGSAWDSKRWPAKYFSDLAARIATKMPVVVLGGPGDIFCVEIAAAAKAVEPKSVDLHGKTSLGESAAILEAASLIVGNDTGLIHLAEACGKEVISIEGPTHPSLGYSVYRSDSKNLGLDLACRPRSKNGRICWRWGSHKCLTGLEVDRVWLAVEEQTRGL